MTEAVDGRATRWAGHRAQRRAELVDAAISAIAEHGPDATAGQMAAAGGISRPLLYRHFDDLATLQLEIAQRAGTSMLASLTDALVAPESLDAAIGTTVDAYLRWVARNPELSLYCLRHFSGPGGLVGGLRTTIAERLEVVLAPAMADDDAATARALAHGVVGLAEGAATQWLVARDLRALPHLAAHLTRWVRAAIATELPDQATASEEASGPGPGT